MPFDSMFIEPRGHSSIGTFNNNHDGRLFEVSKDFGAFAFDSWRLTQQTPRLSFTTILFTRPSSSLLYYGTTHPWFKDLSDNAFPTGIPPFLFGVQQPPVSQSGATTSNHGLRVPHLSKRRRDRGQRSSVSERSFERHKVSSSQIVRVLLGISAREQAGVTTDLAQDPTLVRRLCCSFPYIYSFLGS
jgi:hypothetical protein